MVDVLPVCRRTPLTSSHMLRSDTFLISSGVASQGPAGLNVSADFPFDHWPPRSFWKLRSLTSLPMGPWIETDVDLDKMETVIRVNGKETGRFHTNEMIFGIVPFIVELTKYFTLWPGDVIWMGTDGASPDIKAGDVVEIEITGIGTLRNRFVAEQA